MSDKHKGESAPSSAAQAVTLPDEFPVDQPIDLTRFLRPEALDEEATERWIARQQLPRQLHGIGLDFVLHDVLRRRWRYLIEHLSAGLKVVELEDRRQIQISDLVFFNVWHGSQETSAGAVDGNCFRWFCFNIVRPLPSVSLFGRLLRSQRHDELDLPEHLLEQALPEVRADDRWQLFDLQYFPGFVFDYAGGCVIRRMRRLFLSRPFNTLLCQAMGLNQDDVMKVLRARPEKTERYALHSFFWDRCMRHREQLHAVAAARPLLLPVFGAMLQANEIPAEDAPESVLDRLAVFPPDLRVRYQRNPQKFDIREAQRQRR